MTATKRWVILAVMLLVTFTVAAVAAAQSGLIPAFEDDMPKGQVTYP